MDMWLKCRNWVETNGGFVGNITMASDRRITSLGLISTGESLMIIPRVCQILGSSLSDGIRLLIQELRLGNKSFYDPYLQLLPSPDVFNNHPFRLWQERGEKSDGNEEGNEEFEGYMLNLREQFDVVRAEVVGYNFEGEELMYGFLCFQTRAWLTPDGIISLIPIMDMLNHKALPNGKGSQTRIGLMDLDGNYSMICGECYKQGDEITDYYGCKNNIMLWAQYNFRAIWPVEPIDIAIDSADPKKGEYERVLKYFEPITPALDGNGWNDCLLAFCRVLVLPDSMWPKLKRQTEYYFTEPLARKWEDLVYSSLRQLVVEELGAVGRSRVRDDMLGQVIKDKIWVFERTLVKIDRRMMGGVEVGKNC